MRLITKKSEVRELLAICIKAYQNEGPMDCLRQLHINILSHKVKFPLLEFCGEVLQKELSPEDQIPFCDQIEGLKTEGGNVILGIILQKRLQNHFSESILKATQYIANADIWYVCDIIGERVYGMSLLLQPEATIHEIKNLSTHPTNWVIRSLGAGIHYAIKKGLDKEYVSVLFAVLLKMANTHDKEIRQGVGWAAKTTAKFHPDIIEDHKKDIENEKLVANWFRKKIEIGLNRNNYAKRN